MVEKEKVCVTGGGGYQASWLIKLLLSKGYKVHATVRDPDDEKNAFLKRLEYASENLQLFRADLLDYDSLSAAINGCTGVFHVASPIHSDTVPNPEVEIVEPAVTGTMNVLKASTLVNVKRVVVVSSIGAVIMGNPNWPKGQPMDESCWTDLETCKKSKKGYMWYILAKTTAERQALEYGKKTGLQVVTVCPSMITGPMLQTKIHGSNLLIFMLLKGLETTENNVRLLVDVRDVAEALLLVYEKPEAEGRYICTSHRITVRDMIDKMKNMYPHYNYPKRITDVDEDWDITSEKLQKLGWKYRSVEETLADSIKDYQEKGVLE